MKYPWITNQDYFLHYEELYSSSRERKTRNLIFEICKKLNELYEYSSIDILYSLEGTREIFKYNKKLKREILQGNLEPIEIILTVLEYAKKNKI